MASMILPNGKRKVKLSTHWQVDKGTFHVIDEAPSYYLLRGRNWLHQHQAIASICHQSLKYLENWVDVIAPGNLKPFEEEEE